MSINIRGLNNRADRMASSKDINNGYSLTLGNEISNADSAENLDSHQNKFIQKKKSSNDVGSNIKGSLTPAGNQAL